MINPIKILGIENLSEKQIVEKIKDKIHQLEIFESYTNSLFQSEKRYEI